MGRGIRIIIAGMALVAPVVQAGVAEITDRQVRDSIQKGVALLKSRQNPDRGNWPPYQGGTERGGLTALCTLALLNSGVPPDDPSIRKSLNYLRSLGTPQRIYSTSLITMVLCAGDPAKDRMLIRRNVKWLEAAQIDTGDFEKGAWGYTSRHAPGDNSNSQFALLALNEAQRVGIQVSPRTWRLALHHWRRTQRADGSWAYRTTARGSTPSSGSMTCAGIASMVIASGNLGSGGARVLNDHVRCCGDADEANEIQRGLRWLGKVFSVHSNPGTRSWLLYYLYAVERVGRMTGHRFIGRHDWYREGAEMLVSQQDSFSGHWKGNGAVERSNELIATSFALLFLSKGRRPVVIAKVKYDDSEQWDLHSAGVPNLTRQIEMIWHRDLTWQTVDLEAASVEDLLESPVLFLSGRKSLRLTRDQEDRLREYVNQGGFIFAEACDGNGCQGKGFDVAFRALMRRLFPESRMRLLPSDHPVWFADGKVDPKYLRPLYGIDACCRTSIVYCPKNLACFWELSSVGRESPYSKSVQAEIEACMQIGRNVVAYATNRHLKEKLDRPTVVSGEMESMKRGRGVLVIPKLSHGGGADYAPSALANLLRFVHQKIELRVLAEHRLVDPTSKTLIEYPILFMHGRRDFRWNAAQRKAVADYIQNGGFLFADAICANEQFASAFRREMAAIFPGKKIERIPVNHALFSDEYGGFDLARVTLNDPQSHQEGDKLESRRTRVAPLLEGLQVDRRLAIVFSPNDISCALESNASLQCKGYIKTDAAKIGANIILFALEQ